MIDVLAANTKKVLVRGMAVAMLFSVVAAHAADVVRVYKNPTCGCCIKWVEHLRQNGFTVEVDNVDDTTAYRERLGMPNRYGSCHTATVNGYTIEGHVPAREIKRLLKEKPNAIGLAVPAMVPGSPGMEGPRSFPYQVLLVQRDGQASVYQNYVVK
jgi:hypothetical protein